jgi:hypothetical protein
VFAERRSKAVYSRTSVEKDNLLIRILACRKPGGNFLPPMAIFKGKAYSLESADGFPAGSSVTITDSGGIIETYFHDLITSLSATAPRRACKL